MPKLVAWQGRNELINKMNSTVTWSFESLFLWFTP